MAYELNISLSTYSKIERDITDLTISRLELIGKIFKLSAIDILTYGGENHLYTPDCRKLIEEKDKEIMNLQKELITALKKLKKSQ